MSLQDYISLPQDQTTLLLCLLSSVYLSGLIGLQKWSSLKTACYIFVGMIFLSYGQRIGWNMTFQYVLCMSYTYLAMYIELPPWTVFVLNIAHSLYINTFHENYFSAAFMMLVVKNTRLACSVYDGKEYTDLIEYLGYILHTPTFLIGPPIDIKTYRASTAEVATNSGRFMSFLSLVEALMISVVWLLLKDFDYNYIIYAKESNYSHRFMFLFIAGLFGRCKYYIAWKISEAACLLCGGETDLNHSANIDIISIESATSLKMYIESWNIHTQTWLKECVYKRAIKYPTLTTFAVSALWHGIHPGYYLMFISGAIFLQAERRIRKTVRNFESTRQQSKLRAKTKSVVGWILTQTCINYIGGAFYLLDLQKSFLFWKMYYFIPHVVAVAILLIK